MAIVELRSPFKTFRGRDSVVDGDVLWPDGDRTIARRFVTPSNPNTPDQQNARSNFGDTNLSFAQLSSFDRDAWARLGASFGRTDKNGNPYTSNARDAYVSVNMLRNMAAQNSSSVAPDPADTPVQPFSFAVDRFDIPPDSYRLTVEHARTDGLWLVQQTDQLASVLRRSRPQDFRYWTNPPTLAFTPVTTSPQEIVLDASQARWNVPAGERAGFRLTAISPDFVRGFSLTQDVTIGTGPPAPEWTPLQLVTVAQNINTGVESWSNVNSITAQDGSDAVVNHFFFGNTDHVRGSAAGISIPAGATLQRVAAEIVTSGTSTTVALPRFVLNGTPFTPDAPGAGTPYPATEGTLRFELAVADMSPTPSIADVESAGFGFEISAFTNAVGDQARIDAMGLQAQFTPAE